MIFNPEKALSSRSLQAWTIFMPANKDPAQAGEVFRTLFIMLQEYRLRPFLNGFICWHELYECMLHRWRAKKPNAWTA